MYDLEGQCGYGQGAKDSIKRLKILGKDLGRDDYNENDQSETA